MLIQLALANRPQGSCAKISTLLDQNRNLQGSGTSKNKSPKTLSAILHQQYDHTASTLYLPCSINTYPSSSLLVSQCYGQQINNSSRQKIRAALSTLNATPALISASTLSLPYSSSTNTAAPAPTLQLQHQYYCLYPIPTLQHHLVIIYPIPTLQHHLVIIYLSPTLVLNQHQPVHAMNSFYHKIPKFPKTTAFSQNNPKN